MNARNATTVAAGIKLGIFTLVSIIFTTTLAVIMGGIGLGDHTEYNGIFASASELKKGDDVRVAGVSVGEVTDVEIYEANRARISFTVKSDVPMTTDSRASVRFLNLVGDRYLALEQGSPEAKRLPADGTLPLGQTSPALNLTALFNGFQPLFAALNPEDVNELSMNLIQVLQGEGGTITGLLQQTGELTNSLADRDQLIGEVIVNLTTLMKTVDGHHQQLGALITNLKKWTGNVARDRFTIGRSLENISALSVTLSDLLTQTRPLLKKDVAELRRLFTVLARPENKAMLDKTLETLPTMLARQTRIGVYGSWYNYYLCEFTGGIVLPSELAKTLPPDVVKQIAQFTMHSTVDRCDR
ncbi:MULTISPECIES: MCE family protein [Nocardioides]|uniref:MCE family protein n=1 Tax=Nocardioides TaxID=1839 RepID=UPI00032E5767|nr:MULTISPECIES: MCE family protein [Nocardioides]EON23776.1 virulence factor Mce family protein [Nocardioides sp. CF8]